MIQPERWQGLVAEVLPEVTELRRAIHRHPELAHHETLTTQRIASLLEQGGLRTHRREPRTGLYTDIGSGAKAVAFRADIDALPIDEPSYHPGASEVPGVMHACGHDFHAAIGVGIALVMARIADDLPGTVRFIFQPAEEAFPGGAIELVEEGWIDGLASIMAFHVDPGLPPGKIGSKVGPITGSADRFSIVLEGPGGHTARPHKTVDLLWAMGRVLTELPPVMQRSVDNLHPVTVVFGQANAGSTHNVIPTRVELGGTVRTTDRGIWADLPGLFEKVLHDVLAPTGATATVEYETGLPPVVNDRSVVHLAEQGMSHALGSEALVPTATSMGAEDFSRYLDRIPGALFRLGAGFPEQPVDLHSSSFQADEDTLGYGIHGGVAALLALLKD